MTSFARIARTVLVVVLAPLALAACSSGGGGGGSSSSSSSSGQVSLEVSGLSGTVAAGAATTFAVIARDGSGAVATGYTGTVVFTSTDAQATLPSSFTYGSTDRGTHFFQGGLTLRTSGSQTLTVTDQSFAQVTGAKTVSVTAGAATGFKLALASSEASNVSFSAGTLRAVDSFGNTVAFDASSDGVTITATPSGGAITGLGSGGNARLDRAADFVAGTATLAGKMKFTATPGAYTFSATSASGKTSNAVAVTIFSAPVATTALEVQGFTSTLLAGDATTLVVIARDSNGSIATSYAGTVTFSANDAQAILPSAYSFNAADSGVHVFSNGVTLKTAGPRTITVRDASASLTGTKSLTVTAGPLAAFTLALPATHQRENAFAAGTVTAVDAFGNTVMGFTPTSDAVVISVSPADGDVSGLGGAGADTLNLAGDFVQGRASLAGRLRYSGALGSHTFSATSAVSDKTGTSAPVSIGGVQLHYELSGLPGSTQAGTANQLVVFVKDQSGVLVTGYAGTIAFTATDAQAVLPASVTFVPATDQGVKVFPGVVLRTSGSQTITARDTGDPTVIGTATATVNPGPVSKLSLVLPPTQRQGTAFPASATLTARDAFDNTVAFNAALDPVSITASPAGGTISGLSALGNQLNTAGAFVAGTASLASMIFSGAEGTYTFSARSLAGISGTASVAIENPIVFGVARYLDANQDGICDDQPGLPSLSDTLVIPFGTNIQLVSALPDDFRLFVAGDSFGNGATAALTVVDGVSPVGANGVKITLGSSPTLRTRNRFSVSAPSAGSPSGVDVFPGQDGVRASSTGTPILPATPIDVVPVFSNGASGLGVSSCVATGDFNLDGFEDYVFGDPNNRQFVVRWVPGAARAFNASFIIDSVTAGSVPTAVVVADFNRDGRLDIVSASPPTLPHYHENDASTAGPGVNVHFATAATKGLELGLPASPQSRALAAADFDRDGDPDVVLGLGSGQGTVAYLQTGVGVGNTQFAPLTVPDLATTGDVTAVAAGDVTGDGYADIVVGASNQAIRVFVNDVPANSLFNDSQISLSAAGTTSLTLSDVDRDGDLDMVEGRADGVRIHKNNGLGSFTTTTTGLAAGAGLKAAVGDFDADGTPDIVLTYSSARPRILYNDGSGVFSDLGITLVRPNGAIDATKAIAVADFEKDGDADVFVCDTTNGDNIFFGSATGGFGPLAFQDTNQGLNSSTAQQAGVAADFDGDGDIDLATVSDAAPNRGVRIYANNGAGSFSNVSQTFSLTESERIAAGDFDNDGDVDLAIGIQSTTRVQFLRNDGTGHFSIVNGTATTSNVGGVAGLVFFDLDRDGDQDLISEAKSSTLIWYRNDGGGDFSTSITIDSTTIGTVSQALAVLDPHRKDGSVCFVVAAGNGSRVFLVRPDGNVLDKQTLVTTDATCVATGDVDRDGRPDVIFGNKGDRPSQYFRMTAGTYGDLNVAFASGVNIPSAANQDTVAISLTDLDEDGDLDLLELGAATGQIRVARNTAGAFADTLISLPVQAQSTTLGFVLAFDMDKDGDVDVVGMPRGTASTATVRVFRNK